MDPEAYVVCDDARTVNCQHDNFVDLRSVLRAFLEHLHEQPVELEGSRAYRRLDLELAVLTRSTAYIEEAGTLVMRV